MNPHRVGGLAQLNDFGALYDEGFSLTFRKFLGFLLVGVNSPKGLSVGISNDHLPMMVFAPLVVF